MLYSHRCHLLLNTRIRTCTRTRPWVSGGHYRPEPRANQPLHPALPWQRPCLSENPAAPGGLADRERSNHEPPFPEGRQRPLGRARSASPAGYPGVSECSPKGAGAVDALAFPNGVRRARHWRLAPGTPVCRAHPAAVPQSTARPRSPHGRPRTPPAERPVPLLADCCWLAHPTDPSRPAVSTHSRPSVAPGRNGSRRRADAQGREPPDGPAASGPRPRRAPDTHS